MKKESGWIIKIRLIGLLMSFILLTGSILPMEAQTVYGAAGADTYNTSHQEEYNYSFAIEGENVVVKAVPPEYRDKNVRADMRIYKVQQSETGAWSIGNSKPLYMETSVSFPHAAPLPQEDGTYQVYITLMKQYVEHQSAQFTISNGVASFDKSAVYRENKKIYSKRSTSDTALGFYRKPYDLMGDEKEIKALAEKIVNKNDSDIVKLQKIHDWVSANIWYDYDNYLYYKKTFLYPTEVLREKRTVCSGYALLTSALLRSVGIPAVDVTGPAGAAGQSAWGNHAWNEAYVDGRWIILDTTWDSGNRYENGVFSEQQPVAHTYFDPTLEAFSQTHQIVVTDYYKNEMEREFLRALSISNTSLIMAKGKTRTISVKVKKDKEYKYIHLKDAKITYKSSNPKVASVSKKGRVKSKKAGNAVITTTVKLEGVTLKFHTRVYVTK